VEHSICRLVLDDLVRAKFLYIAQDGTYRRRPSQPPTIRLHA